MGRAYDVGCNPHNILMLYCYAVYNTDVYSVSSSCFYIMLLLDVLYIMIHAMLLAVLYTAHGAAPHVSVNHGHGSEAHTDTMGSCAKVVQTHPTGIQRPLQKFVNRYE